LKKKYVVDVVVLIFSMGYLLILNLSSFPSVASYQSIYQFKNSSRSIFKFFIRDGASFFSASLSFRLVCKHSWLLWCCFEWLSGGVLFILRQTTLYLLLSGLFLPVFCIFHPSIVVELAHLGVQTRARRSTVMRSPYPSVCRLWNVSVVADLCCWHGIFLPSIL
jgi:hypothetical protein